MNKILLFLFFTPLIISAQINLDSTSKTFAFSKVYDVQKSKTELNQQVQEWIAINFKDANEVIKLNTEDKIITKGYFDISYTNAGYSIPGKIYFVLETSFKENKYKLDLHTFELKQKEYTFPVENYYFANDYDFYVELLKAQSSQFKDKFSIKYYDKLFKNPEKLRELYNDYNLVASEITTEINQHVEAYAQSLFQYIVKNDSKDW